MISQETGAQRGKKSAMSLQSAGDAARGGSPWLPCRHITSLDDTAETTNMDRSEGLGGELGLLAPLVLSSVMPVGRLVCLGLPGTLQSSPEVMV